MNKMVIWDYTVGWCLALPYKCQLTKCQPVRKALIECHTEAVRGAWNQWQKFAGEKMLEAVKLSKIAIMKKD